jgi:hypothetical protein
MSQGSLTVEASYKAHFITASAYLEPGKQKWRCAVGVLCPADGAVRARMTHPFFDATYGTQEEAETAGLKLAMKWIDEGKP